MNANYVILLQEYEENYARQTTNLSKQYGVELNSVQRKIVSAIDANAHSLGRPLTTFEQRQKAHMIYGYRQ